MRLTKKEERMLKERNTSHTAGEIIDGDLAIVLVQAYRARDAMHQHATSVHSAIIEETARQLAALNRRLLSEHRQSDLIKKSERLRSLRDDTCSNGAVR